VELFTHLQAWHWFALAVILIVLEVTTTFGFLLGIAFAALVLALAVFIFPEFALNGQLLTFGVLSVLLTLGYRRYFKPVNDATDNPLLNDRAAQMIGKSFMLSFDLDRSGADMVGDTRWALRSAGRINKGVRVRIIGVDGMVLCVEEDV
jgi:membrane protein implicated in regulation of membrane protease activity